MSHNKIILIPVSFLLLFSTNCMAQKQERDFIRQGNKAYNDSLYEDASVKYLKALDVNPKSTISMYNLGNTYLRQNNAEEAMKQYSAAADIEKDKKNLAQIYHNMGVIMQSNKDYARAVEAYKQSLRNNPSDDETRYNLALAQKLLKDQQGGENNQDQQKQDEQQQQEKKEQQQQQQNQQQQQQQQQQPKENKMSKETAEQLLKSVMQDEKDTQDKRQKAVQLGKRGRLEKDW